MSVPRVSIVVPPGTRACGGVAGNRWQAATEDDGSQPFAAHLAELKRAFPSPESRAEYVETIREWMDWAQDGRLPWDAVTQMQVAKDVLEIKLPDWIFSEGKMHVRLYFSEPRDLPGVLVALGIHTKRPGPIDLELQNQHAMDASDLLLKFQDRGFK